MLSEADTALVSDEIMISQQDLRKLRHFSVLVTLQLG